MRCRNIATLSVLLIAVFSVQALACRIPIIEPIEPRPGPVSQITTRAHRAEITIAGNVASVNVSATFYNPNNFQVEGTYFFPIEADAVVQDFVMTVNGKEQHAELLPANEARTIYENIVRQMRDPGLLEYVGMKMLKARVFPIMPHKEIDVRLTYHQIVRSDAGLYHFRYPLESAKPNTGTVNNVSVKVDVSAKTPIKLFYSPSHTIDVTRHGDNRAVGGFEQADVVPSRNFDLYYSLDESDIGVSAITHKPRGEDGFCLISLTPRVETDPGDIEPKDIVFVFDKSGSMSGSKIEQARRALNYCLNRLNAADRFSVIAFSTAIDTYTDGLVQATPDAIEQARQRVEKMQAAGGTAIHEALKQACKQLEGSDRLPVIVFLTDGMPTVGVSDVKQILKDTKDSNAAKARIFSFGVGYNVNTDLLDRLATENRGTQQYVVEEEDIEVKVSSFYGKVSQPVLRDVTISISGVKLTDTYPQTLPDVFHGGQVLVFARYEGSGKRDVVVRGKAGGKTLAFECTADFDGSASNDFLPPVWANRKVAFLLDQIRTHGHNQELQDEVVALGKRYGIMTPYTSFLIVEDGDTTVAPGIARRALEEDKSGKDAVRLSRKLSEKRDKAPMPADDGRGEGAIGYGDEATEEAVNEASRERIRHIADKVFYLDTAEGVYYDSTYDEKDEKKIVEVEAFSDDYFKLLDKHPEIGKYLSANIEFVICIDKKIYRIKVKTEDGE